MKTRINRLLSLLLCAVLLTACLPLTLAADAAITPVIVVSGMGSFPMYDGEIDPDNQVWAPQAKTILNVVGKSLWPLAKAALRRDLNVFADESFPLAYEAIFDAVACDETGTPLHELTTPKFPQSVDHYQKELLDAEETEDEIGIIKGLASRVGAEHVYFFNYDFRLSPYIHAADLNAYIAAVKAEQHASKVTLVPCSMGGIVVNTYLSAYGSGDIDRIIYTMVASKGIDLVGELFNQNFSVDLSVLTERLFNFEEGKLFSQAMLSLLKTVTDITPGLRQVVNRMAARLLAALSDRVFKDIIAKSLVTMPGMWAFVPDAYYASAKQTLFPDGMNETFRKTIDDYHYNVQNQAEALMQAAKDSGVQMYVLAAYGYVGFPMTDKAYEQSDCLIETKNESFGATVARYGETLGRDYRMAGTVCSDPAHHHVSTDNIVDASTCLFPEQTWFLKYNRHVGIPCDTDAAALMAYLATSETQTTVHADSRFPQFVHLNLITGKFASLTGETVRESLFDKESNTLIRTLKLIRDFFDWLKNKMNIQ